MKKKKSETESEPNVTVPSDDETVLPAEIRDLLKNK